MRTHLNRPIDTFHTSVRGLGHKCWAGRGLRPESWNFGTWGQLVNVVTILINLTHFWSTLKIASQLVRSLYAHTRLRMWLRGAAGRRMALTNTHKMNLAYSWQGKISYFYDTNIKTKQNRAGSIQNVSCSFVYNLVLTTTVTDSRVDSRSK